MTDNQEIQITKEEFENDPFQPDQRQVDRDSKRL